MKSIIPMFKKGADGLEEITKIDEVKERFLKLHGHEMYDAIAAVFLHDEPGEVEFLAEQLEAIVKRYIFDNIQY